ncbi:hypothetical protein QJ036_07055 [Ruminococcus sp. YH-rum2234]|uniref:Uncharacterized protein n=1 Tax=Fusibacillus kribbianus TaxID=3044208 RepID=A0AAP4BAH5_9FIRM|nr:hypothetical protein [Ruminococcus sp. YH-rum2234]MDI9242237.1 hypothetical protein [Ruminococcus sp. YH-rum2234]
MAGLFKYEWKKLFSKKIMIFLLIFLFLFNGLMVYRESRQNIGYGYQREDVGKVYDDLENMTALEAEIWLKERIRFLDAVDVWREWTDGQSVWTEEERQAFREYNREIMEEYSDLNINEGYLLYLNNLQNEKRLLRTVLEQVSEVAHYREYLDGIENEAKIMTSSSLFGEPGTFIYRNIVRTPQAYEHLKGQILPAEDSEGILLATESRVTDLLLLCLFLLLGLSMLLREREEGTILLIKPTKKGYWDTISAKFILFLILTTVGTVLFYLSNLIIGGRTLGLGSLERPIQSMKGFLTSPYEMTVGGYLVGFFGAKVSAALVWGALIFCFCTVFKNAVNACLVIGALFLAEIVLYQSISLHSYLSPFKIMNLVCLANTDWFFCDYLNMNFLGWPVNIVPLCILLGLLVFGVFSWGAIHRYMTEVSVQSEKSRLLEFLRKKGNRRAQKRRQIRTGLFGKEFFKLFIMERAWILLVIFAFLQWSSYRNFTAYREPDDQSYYGYIIKTEGVSLSEAGQILESENERFTQKEEELRQASEDYEAGTLSRSKYEAIRLSYEALNQTRTGLERAMAQYEYVRNENREGRSAELFYDTGWKALLEQNGRQADVKNAGLLSFFLILGLAAVFSIEKRTQMELLLHTCVRGGESVCIRKYLSCFFYGTIAFFLAYVPQYLAVFGTYGFHGLMAPLRSLELLKDVPFNVPLWVYLCLVGLSRYLGMLVAVGLILWLSRQCGDLIHILLIAMLLLELPVFLCLMGLTGEMSVSLLPMMTGADMYRFTVWRILYWCAAIGIGVWFYFRTYKEEVPLEIPPGGLL